MATEMYAERWITLSIRRGLKPKAEIVVYIDININGNANRGAWKG
jgi:hypothetical protein